MVLIELRTEVSLCCDGSMLYIGSDPILTGRFTLPPLNGDRFRSYADVDPHHRFVPEELYVIFKVPVEKSFGSLHVQV